MSEVCMTIWHDESDRLAAWGTLDPPDACMCRECVLGPSAPSQEQPGGEQGTSEGGGRDVER